MNKFIYYIIFFFLAFSSFSQNVPVGNGKKIIKKLNANQPKPKGITLLDTTDLLMEDDSLGGKGYYYLGSSDMSFHTSNDPIVYDDYDSVAFSDAADVVIYDVRKVGNPLVRRILLDSAYWTRIEPSFRSFDTMGISPYRIAPARYKDTATLQLFGKMYNKEFGWSMPVARKPSVTSPFGPRWGRWHAGTDLDIDVGDSILAAFDGVVRVTHYHNGGYGNFIIIRHHNGLESLYGHLQKSKVKVGQEVKAGELIGLGGNTGRSTGPHLHFELRYLGRPFNTERIFDYRNQVVKDQYFKYNPGKNSTATSSRKVVYHRVKRGESLSTIASKYHVSVSQIRRLNHLSKNAVIRAGRTLRVR